MEVATSPELNSDNHDLKQRAVARGIDHDQLELKTISEGDHEADRILRVNTHCTISGWQERCSETAILGPILAFLGQDGNDTRLLFLISSHSFLSGTRC